MVDHGPRCHPKSAKGRLTSYGSKRGNRVTVRILGKAQVNTKPRPIYQQSTLKMILKKWCGGVDWHKISEGTGGAKHFPSKSNFSAVAMASHDTANFQFMTSDPSVKR